MFVAIAVASVQVGVGRRAPLSALLVYLAVWNWISRDHRAYPGVLSRYGGVGFFLLWPLLVPFYLVETRGWKRALVAFVAFFGLMTAVGFAVGGILLRQP